MKMKDIHYDKSGKAGRDPAGTALFYRKNPAEIRAYFIIPRICESVSLERADELTGPDPR